jgi:hypothetical protein
MNFDDLITRRETLKRLITISGAVGFFGANEISFAAFAPAQTKAAPRRFIIEGIGQTEGYSIKELATRIFDAAGGVARFVSKRDVVAIKPNISWARRPALAATTNPVVLEAVTELCPLCIPIHRYPSILSCFSSHKLSAIGRRTP